MSLLLSLLPSNKRSANSYQVTAFGTGSRQTGVWSCCSCCEHKELESSSAAARRQIPLPKLGC